MKVFINPPKPPRKEYTNLPERDPNRDRLRKAKVEQVPESGATFGPQERPDDQPASAPEARPDLLGNFLSDSDPIPSDATHEHDTSWKNSRWVPTLFLLAIGVLGGIWYFATHFEQGMSLGRIRVQGAHLLKDQEIIQLAEIDRDQKFYDIDLKKIEVNLLRHSLIQAAHPRREVNPATIVLDIVERQPVAMERSEATGEAYIIDRDGFILRPKLLAGLKDPKRILQVPLLTGVPDKDTAGLRYMAKLVMMMQSLDSGALQSAIGELHRTPTGAYVIYTVETQTPIFIGSPYDAAFRTALEEQRSADSGNGVKEGDNHFIRQIKLLATLWKKRLQQDLRTNAALYVDARFSGQVIVKPRAQTKNSVLRTVAAQHAPDSLHAQFLTSVTTAPPSQGMR